MISDPKYTENYSDYGSFVAGYEIYLRVYWDHKGLT